MADWLTNKGAGPWEFAKQSDKKGFVNNPLWVAEEDATDRHKPCGYWLNGEYIRTSTDVIVEDYVQGTAWVEKAPKYPAAYVYGVLAVYNNKLYATINGDLFVWNDEDAWVLTATSIYVSVSGEHLIVCGDYLYNILIADSKNRIIRYVTGESVWTEVNNIDYTYGLFRGAIAFANDIYISTSDGTLFDSALNIVAAAIGSGGSIYTMRIYNNKLYAGVYGSYAYGGRLYEWNGTNAWIKKANGIIGSSYLQSIINLFVYEDSLYGFGISHVGYSDSSLLKWNDTDAWEVMRLGTRYNTNTQRDVILGDRLYTTLGKNNILYYWSEDLSECTLVASDTGLNDAFHNLVLYNDHIYTIGDGKLFEFNSTITEHLTRVITEEIDPLEIDNAVWPFSKQGNKLTYNEGHEIATANDPVWNAEPKNTLTPITPTHIPCGYWTKGYVPTTTPAPLVFRFEFKILSAGDSFRLPLCSNGTYDFTVSWGDGDSDNITGFGEAAGDHTYTAAGTYIVEIRGTIIGWSFENDSGCWQIYDVQSWGPLDIGNNGSNFRDCGNLTISATDGLDCPDTTNFSFIFSNCDVLTTVPENTFTKCVSAENFSSCFYGSNCLVSIPATLFSTCIKATTFSVAFYGCSSLEEIPTTLFDSCPLITTLAQCFSFCRSVLEFPTGLIKNNTKLEDCFRTFYYCLNMTGKGVSFVDAAISYGVTSYSYCFYKCNNLSDYSSIPNDWK